MDGEKKMRNWRLFRRIKTKEKTRFCRDHTEVRANSESNDDTLHPSGSSDDEVAAGKHKGMNKN